MQVTEWEKVWSRLSAHLQPFFRLLARILTIFDKKYYILTCRDKRESYLVLLQLALSVALCGSYWLSPWHTLALSGSLLLSNFAYTVLDLLSGPLLGSQHRYHADTLSPALASDASDASKAINASNASNARNASSASDENDNQENFQTILRQLGQRRPTGGKA